MSKLIKGKVEANGSPVSFANIVLDTNKKGVLRGMHYQTSPLDQGKLVRCTSGSVFDVIIDLRKSSDTYSYWAGIKLDSQENYQLWIPSGFAHGFLTLEENTIVAYNSYGKYQPKHEHTICWDDKTININWNIKDPIISKKDKKGMSLEAYKTSKNIYG